MSVKRFQVWDSLRLFSVSSYEPVVQTIAMYIMVVGFEGSLFDKTLLATLIPSGLLLNIFILSLFSKFSLPKNILLFILALASGLSLIGASFSNSKYLYVFLIVLVSVSFNAMIPICSEFYSGYKKEQRAKRFTVSLISMTIGTLFFTSLYDYLLEEKGIEHNLLLTLSGFVFILASFFCLQFPRETLRSRNINLKEYYHVLKSDKLFLYICIAWYILGVGNLWIMPYRTNYLLEERYGFSYDASKIMYLLVVVPAVVRLITTPLFAYIFDRMNFVTLRMLFNVLFMIYIYLLLFGKTEASHFAAMIFFGMAMAGGSIAWNLWTTRFAPKEKVSVYMSIHAALTGSRAILAPLVGLAGLEYFGPKICGGAAIAMILFSTLMMFPILKYGHDRFSN